MTNPYYNHASYPATGAPGSSAGMRSELDAIQAGFALLPTLSGNADKVVVINGAGTAQDVASTTGTGNIVRADGPTLSGNTTVGTVNKLTITAPATGATLALANNSSFATVGAYAATLTFTGITGVTFPTSGTLATLAGAESLSNKTLVAPALGTPTSGTLTNCTGLPVAGGGTGLATTTAYSPVFSGTTATGAFQANLGPGTSGQVLISAGAGALPAWGAVTAASVQGARKNLRSSASGTSANIAITADELVVETTTNLFLTLRTVSLTLNTAGSGANGLDTGTLAASTIYHKWVIYNPTTLTAAALLSLSSTAPTMPSGYTYKARVGAIPTDSSGNKYPLSHVSFDADTNLVVSSTTNVTARPALISGVQGNAVTPTWVSASISAFVPSTASRVRGNVGSAGGVSTGLIFAPNNQYSGSNSTTNPPPVLLNTSNTSLSVPFDFDIESTNLYYACNTANGFACLGGWTDTI